MNLLPRIIKHQKAILLAAILLYIGVFSVICLWKYSIFGYEGLDLAIFNNVFWQTSEGHWFAQSIHPHSYLGDHAGFGLFALVPFYFLRRGPEILLILQTIALAAAAWPLYKLASRLHTPDSKLNKTWQLAPLVVALAWLLNPIVHNINLYEFHLLPFALVPLFYMLLAYERHQLGRFVLFAALAMLFREDVSFVVAAVGVLAALEKRGHWWRIVPIFFGAAWFLAATSLISRFAPNGSYKFSVYYSWLGDAPTSLLPHLLSAGNLEMLLGFGMPLLFLPFVTPKRLVLAAGPLLQIILSAPGGSAVVLQTHYATLFLPGIFAASIAAISYFSSRKSKVDGRKSIFYSPAMLGLVLLTAFYSALTVGPVPNAVARIMSGEDAAIARDAAKIIAAIPADEPIVASYSLLPHLSSREHIYSAHYVFLGVEQFATGPYELPTDITTLLAFDDRDLITYRMQMLRSAWSKPHYDGGRERLALLAGPPQARAGHYAVFGPLRSSIDIGPLFDRPPNPLPTPLHFDDGTSIDGYLAEISDGRLNLHLDLTLGDEPNEAKQFFITLGDQSELVVPLINELRQPTTKNERYELETSLPIPNVTSETQQIILTLVSFEGLHVLDRIGTSRLEMLERQEHGQVTLTTTDK